MDLAAYFEESVGGGDGKRTANWVINEVLGRANKADLGPREIVAPEVNAAILAMVARDEISTKIAKDVLEKHIESGRAPEEIVETEGMKQVTDTGAIEAAVDQIIADNPAQVEKAKANPKAVNEIIQQKLGLG